MVKPGAPIAAGHIAVPNHEHDQPLVEFFFSPGSRYSYLVASQIPSIEADTGCRVEWRPVDGPDIRALRGRDPFAGGPVSCQFDWSYRWYDAELWADYYGIPFREPPTHTFDFRPLALAATVARRLGAAADYGWGVWRPLFRFRCVVGEREGMRPAGGGGRTFHDCVLGAPDGSDD